MSSAPVNLPVKQSGAGLEPLCSVPLPVASFLDACRAVVETYKSEASQRIAAQTGIDKRGKRVVREPTYRVATIVDSLQDYLNGQTMLALSEEWVDAFLMARRNSDPHRVWRLLATVVEKKLIPEGSANRPMATTRMAWKNRSRYDAEFTPETQADFDWLLHNMHKLRRRLNLFEAQQLNTGVISPLQNATVNDKTAFERVNRLKILMRVLKVRDIRAITPEMLQQYARTGGGNAAKTIHELRNVFINLCEARRIPTNPISGVVYSLPHYHNDDFITLPDMQKVIGCRLPDAAPFSQWRDRLATLVAFDVALREKELRGLLNTDIRQFEDGSYYVWVRDEIQKGRKPSVPIPFFFPEIVSELTVYMDKLAAFMSDKKARGPYSLFPNSEGNAFNESHLSGRVKTYMEAQGVRTKANAPVTVHILRHTFANVAPELDPLFTDQTISERLRHSSPEITRKIYQSRGSPYFIQKQAERQPTRQNGNGDSSPATTFGTSEDVYRFGRENGLPEKQANIMALSWQRQQSSADVPADDLSKFSMSETEAFGMLHDSGIKTPAAMRQHFLTTHGAKARGRGCVYSREAVTTFATKWVCVEAARRDRLAANRRTIGRTTLFSRIKTGFEHVTIGKAVFVQRDSIARLLVP